MTKLKDLEPRIWFADTEVFAHDNIWVFTQYGTGATEVFWNDNEGVQDFIRTEHPILCGYNFRDYDQHILKGNLCGMSPEELKEVNDILIQGGDDKFDDLFAYFRGKFPKVGVPPIIDLFHDIVPRRSLKVIEGNLGMSVRESSVDFNIERALTHDEITESIEYCKYDVYATSVLYEHRRDYLQSKITLCDICNEDPLPMLKHSNARILSEVFHAEPYEYDTEEKYVIPETIDLSGIPEEVLDYVGRIDCSVATRDNDLGKLEFEFHGVPSVFGIGGIHSADEVPYIEEETEDRVLLIQDITSYYPSIILNYGYTSRAAGIECRDLYRHFYDLRVKAKAEGNKEAANAAKLVLNTYSGAMGSKYNKLYDPMMPLGLRITGQLAIMDAVNCAMRNASTARFIQLNTDGWVLSVDRSELDSVLVGVREWEERTGFSVDTQYIKKLVQRDVNNYILEKPDGSVKVKGGTVALANGADFKSNSLAICNEAVVNLLLHGRPIRDTIEQCDDLEKFQSIAKAGSTFSHTTWQYDENHGMLLHKCNRIFATKDKNCGMVYKVKVVDGETKYSKVPNCPEHAYVLNDKLPETFPEWLDREWYIDYATKKAKEFVNGAIGYGGQDMSEEIKEVKEVKEVKESTDKPKRKAPAKKAVAPKKGFIETIMEKEPVNINEALFKLQVLMTGNSGSVKFDGYIDNINYSYADTQQYKMLLASCATECGLIFGMDVIVNPDKAFGEDHFVQHSSDVDRAINGPRTEDDVKRSRMVIAAVDVEFSFTFFKTGERQTFVCSGMGVGTQGNSLSIAITNAIRNFITNNFMLDNKGRDGDDVAANNLEQLASNATKKYVTESEKREIKNELVADKKEEAKYATTAYAKALYPKLKKASALDSEFAKKAEPIIERAYDGNGAPITVDGDADHSIMKRAAAGKLMREAEGVIESGKAEK